MRANKLGEAIDKLGNIRSEITRLNKEADELSKVRRALEADIMDMLEENGMQKASSHSFTVGMSEETVPTVTDWDALHSYIVENNMPYLLQRRPTVKAFQELFEAGESVPGVQPYTTAKLYLRTL